MNTESPIGFFDSGVGGLSVYSKFRQLLPSENTIYYGDLKNLPYGNKTPEQLISFARKILNFFKSKEVKAVVIACNTSSALAYNAVKDDYDFKIYPIIQSCAKVIAGMNIERIGIFATPATVQSQAYKKELLKHNSNLEIKEIACPNWVSIVEGVDKNVDSELDIKTHLEEMMGFEPDRIILGCTHYPYLLHRLTKYVSKDLFIDPAEIFVDFIKSDMCESLNRTESIGKEEFVVSAYPQNFLENSKLFYKLTDTPSVNS